MPCYSFDCTVEVDAILILLASKKKCHKGEILSRAIALYKFVEDEVTVNPDHKLAITSSNGNVVKYLRVR